MKKIIVISILLIAALSLGAIVFSETYGGSEYENGSYAQQTADGGYIFVGDTQSYGAGYWDAWIVKTDANGTMEWHNSFGGLYSDGGESVQQTTDGGYILAGSTTSFGAGSHDIRLIKTDAYGDSIWTKTFGGTSYDVVSTVQQTTDGGYILSGQTLSYGAGSYDAWLIKTDENGILEWDATYGGVDADKAFSVQQTTDDGYIIAGLTESFSVGMRDVWLIKTDVNGTQEWDATYGDSGDDIAFSVQQTADGGYIIAGETTSYGNGDYDVWLIKTDENGSEQWNNTFGGTDTDKAFDVKQTTDGGYIMAAWTWSFGAGIGDAWIIKTDASGTLEWEQLYGGYANDVGQSVEQTPDGGYIIGATTNSSGAGSGDFWLIKTDANGSIIPNVEIEVNPDEFVLEMMSNEILNDEFTISNIGSGTVNYDIEFNFINGDDWFSLEPNSGELLEGETDTIEVTFDTTDLMAEIYQGEIIITYNGDETIIPVTLTVFEAEIEIDPDEFVLEMISNEISIDEFTISNIGSGTVNYDIEINFINGDGWLSPDPNSGELLEDETDTIEITFDTTDLIAGIYESEIVITYNGDLAVIPITLTVSGTDVEEDAVSNVTELFGNYPNPFNPITTINYNLAEENNVTLEIYNLKGHKVKSLVNVHQSAGQHSIVWNGTDENNKSVSSGVYFYKLRSGRYTSNKKMILMK